mmetsp:Transcript_23208/g.64109  ORF Transcript_23208/g.64109 Transcript_23208/m.64109 type:complete len:218 (+) Transcript_23208:3103-3756(+)
MLLFARSRPGSRGRCFSASARLVSASPPRLNSCSAVKRRSMSTEPPDSRDTSCLVLSYSCFRVDASLARSDTLEDTGLYSATAALPSSFAAPSFETCSWPAGFGPTAAAKCSMSLTMRRTSCSDCRKSASMRASSGASSASLAAGIGASGRGAWRAAELGSRRGVAARRPTSPVGCGEGSLRTGLTGPASGAAGVGAGSGDGRGPSSAAGGGCNVSL